MSELRLTQGALEVISAGEKLRATAVAIEVISVAAEGADPVRVTQASLEVIQPGAFPPRAPALSATQVSGTSFALETGDFQGVEDGDEHESSTWQVTTAADTEFASAVSVTSETALRFYLADELDPETAFITRAQHRGTIGGDSPWSNVVEFTTTEAVPRPTTPTVTVDAHGTDFVVATRSAFDHAEGVGDGSAGEDGEILPYEIAGQWQIRRPADSWDDAVVDTGLNPLFVGVLTSLFDGLTPGTAYEIRFRTQDGKYGALSLWSTAAAFTTDAVPAVRPATPTLSVDSCGWPETYVSGSAFSHPESGTHAQSRWWIGREDSDGVLRYASIFTSISAELTAFLWRQLSPGVNYLAVSYIDNDGRESERSPSETCTIRDVVDTPTLTSHAAGTVIATDTLWQWEMPDTGTWTFSGEISTDNGVTWAPLFGPQPEAEYLFSITGRPNGFYLLRVRACYPDHLGDCSDWLVVPFRIDRSGAISVDYQFRDLEEIPSTWVPMWDPDGDVSWTLVDRNLQPVDQEGAGPAVGIHARHGVYLAERDGVLAFTEFGEPVELDITVSFAVLQNVLTWHGWRFSQSYLTAAGPAYRVRDASTTGGEKSGFGSMVHTGHRGWAYSDGECTSDPASLRDRAKRDRPIVARALPDRIHRYGTSGGEGTEVRLFGYREQRESHWIFRNGEIATTGALRRGLSWSLPRENPEEPGDCPYRFVTYSARKRVTREPDGWYRIRVQVYGPGIDSTQGPQVDFLIDPNAPLASDPSWAFRDALCGACGLYYWQLPFLTNDPGVLFQSLSVQLPDTLVLTGPIYGTPTVEATP